MITIIVPFIFINFFMHMKISFKEIYKMIYGSNQMISNLPLPVPYKYKFIFKYLGMFSYFNSIYSSVKNSLKIRKTILLIRERILKIHNLIQMLNYYLD